MPLPTTPSYQERLSALHHLAPQVADLAARIAQAITPQRMASSASTLEGELFAHLQAIGQQQARSVTRLGVWFYLLVQAQALMRVEAAAFLNEAARHAGPSGVIPQ